MDQLQKIYNIKPTRGLKCNGCNLGQDYYSNGHRCLWSGLFFHETCAKSDLRISSLYHPQHSLHIKVVAANEVIHGECKLCRGNLPKMYYYCSICDFAIDLVCAKKEVMTTIGGPKIHTHRLSLVPEMIKFTCHLCGLDDDRFPYVCNLCDLSFHKDCAESIPELNYSCHPKHPLKLQTCVPSYSDGRCFLCRNILQNVFYHCSICNFSVDINCKKNPPLFTLDNPKAHEHPLILMPQRSFVCNACGIEDDDDPNPYVCPHCNFMIHRNCVDIPRIIKINRHIHRIQYKHCLNAGDWKCGVCHKKIKWTCGAYSCLGCPGFAVHTRCATRFGIWDGIELEGMPENITEVKSYEVIGEGIIKHFSHEDHALKLKENNDPDDEGMLCKACISPVFSSPFYSCMECSDDFIIHQKCAHLPKKKIDPFYKMSVTLITSEISLKFFHNCVACQNYFQGFRYVGDNYDIALDVRCGSISEPFVHQSHPLHPLYIDHSFSGDNVCNACGDKASMVLRCEKDECEFVLDIKCSILPKMVKHKNDPDHFLSLCYGEKKTNEVYWCEVCEKELDPEKWFYSCDHCDITLHIKCTLGDSIWFQRAGYDAVVHPNNRITRPICDNCNSRCRFPHFLNSTGGGTYCSLQCVIVPRL